jgi:hypothetical protein
MLRLTDVVTFGPHRDTCTSLHQLWLPYILVRVLSYFRNIGWSLLSPRVGSKITCLAAVWWGHTVATSRKVDSIPDEVIGFFN